MIYGVYCEQSIYQLPNSSLSTEIHRTYIQLYGRNEEQRKFFWCDSHYSYITYMSFEMYNNMLYQND